MSAQKLKNQASTLNAEMSKALELGGLGQEGKQTLIGNQAKVQRINRVLGLRPTTAVYGKSQVGKSYLISRLFSLNGRPITLDFPGEKVDFIDEVNPAGHDQEATGVVSRFTIAKPSDSDFPVRVEIMRPAELLQIWIDSFVEDSDGSISYEWQPPHVSTGSDESLMKKTEVVELKDYVENKLSSKSPHLTSISQTDFWEKSIDHISQLASDSELFVRWFENLWACQPEFSKALRLLLKSHSMLGSEDGSHVHVAVNTVKRTDRQGKGLIDVETLRNLLLGAGMVDVKTSNGIMSVSVESLSALTKEVVLPIESALLEENPFLRDSDFLDFPGARTSLDGAKVEEDSVMDFFLRSKVRYLFRSYCANYEINNLMWCLDGGNMEARGQIDDVDLWMEYCVGESMDLRAEYVKRRGCQPLAVVQTKFDKALAESGTIDGRIGSHFVNEVNKKGYDWLDRWDGDTFQEIHFLRNPEFSTTLFSGFDKKAGSFLETEVKNHEKLDLAKSVLFSNDWITKHCSDLEGKWEGVSKPNEVGLESIRSFLNEAANKSGAEVNLELQLCNIQSDFLKQMRGLVVSEDASEQLKAADKAYKEIERALKDAALNFMRQPHREEQSGAGFVDQAQRLLMTTPLEVNRILENLEDGEDAANATQYQDFLSLWEGFRKDMSEHERLTHLAEIRGESTEDTQEFLDDEGIDLSQLFAEERVGVANGKIEGALTELIFEKLQIQGAAAKWMMDAGMPQQAVEMLLNELGITIAERKLGSLISMSMKSMKAANAGIQHDESRMLSNSVSHWWNECLLLCDARFFTDDEIQNLQIVSGNHDDDAQPYVEKLKAALGEELWDSIDAVAQKSFQTRLNTWLTSIKNSFRANTKAIDIDIERNEKLVRLIEKTQAIELCK